MMQTDPTRTAREQLEAALRGGHSVWAFATIPLPPPGETVVPLPPAPDPETGWLMYPYLINWDMQIGSFLRSHFREVKFTQVPFDGPVNQYEAIRQITEVRGWQN
jgi:hypothetical protein